MQRSTQIKHVLAHNKKKHVVAQYMMHSVRERNDSRLQGNANKIARAPDCESIAQAQNPSKDRYWHKLATDLRPNWLDQSMTLLKRNARKDPPIGGLAHVPRKANKLNIYTTARLRRALDKHIKITVETHQHLFREQSDWGCCSLTGYLIYFCIAAAPPRLAVSNLTWGYWQPQAGRRLPNVLPATCTPCKGTMLAS